MNIYIKKFKLEELDIRDHSLFNFLIIGSRGAGKTNLIRNLSLSFHNIPNSLIFCNNQNQYHYLQILSDCYIYSDPLETQDKFNSIIHETFDEQKKKINLKNKKKDNRLLLILDDCIKSYKWINDPIMSNLIMNGRHYQIIYFVCLSYCMALNSISRRSFDYIFIFRCNDPVERNRLYNYYGIYAGIPTLDIFNQIMDKLNQYECLVICNSILSFKLEDKIKYYKSPNLVD